MANSEEQSRPDAKGVTLWGIALGASLFGATTTSFLTPQIAAAWGVLMVALGLGGVVRKDRRSRAVLALLVGALLLLVAIPAPMVQNSTRLKARRIADVENLRSIGVAIADFQASHGRLPADLGELLDAGCIPDVAVLVCPGQRHRHRPPVTGDDVRAGRCGYLYWGAQIPTDADPDTVIACTRPGLVHRPGMFRKGFYDVVWNYRTVRGDNYVSTLTLGGLAQHAPQPSKEILARIEEAGPKTTKE